MIPGLSERALVVAPHGRDALVATAILREAGFRAHPCESLSALVAELKAGAGFAVITEEALHSADLHPLAAWLGDQPEWSDFPFVLLTERGGGLERNPAATRFLETLGNVTFLERPFHPTTLVSLARAARRGRRRQYEARARLQALHESESQLRTLAAELERRVEERTAEHEQALAQLHEAQKLETIGQLTGGVAHDFNNLLTPITGALDLMLRRYGGSDPNAERLITGALQSAERAKLLVQRLLGFARRQALQPQAVDIPALLTGMRDLIASSIGPAVELVIVAGSNLAPALVDPNQLELAILNLCVNARDAMPAGGTLTLATEQVTVGYMPETKLAPGQYILLSVIDTGVGMDSETLARAIEPFFSTKETGRGTGLGLSMVHGLAGQLGGWFALTSALGEGTRADLWLPIAEGNAGAAREVAIARATPRPEALSVLLVDDEKLVREATAAMLRELGHSVTEMESGIDALAQLAVSPRFDVVVTDYKMPRIDGAELARRVREMCPDMPVLLITGYAGGHSDMPNLPRLAKPFRQAEVAALLARLVPVRREGSAMAGAEAGLLSSSQ